MNSYMQNQENISRGNSAHGYGQRQPQSHAGSYLSDQINIVGYGALQLLRIGASFEFQEVVFEADAFPASGYDLYAKGCEHSHLSYQMNLKAYGDNSIERESQIQKQRIP